MVKVKKHVDVDGSEYWTSNIHKQLFEINGYDLHREDGPAIIFSTGGKCWFRYGKRHREDGPAIIHPNSAQQWFLYGKRHRTDGPAIIYSDGSEEWYIHDMCHREDGPAIRTVNGNIAWYLNGRFYEFDEWCEELNKTDEEKALLKLEYM